MVIVVHHVLCKDKNLGLVMDKYTSHKFPSAFCS